MLESKNQQQRRLSHWISVNETTQKSSADTDPWKTRGMMIRMIKMIGWSRWSGWWGSRWGSKPTPPIQVPPELAADPTMMASFHLISGSTSVVQRRHRESASSVQLLLVGRHRRPRLRNGGRASTGNGSAVVRSNVVEENSVSRSSCFSTFIRWRHCQAIFNNSEVLLKATSTLILIQAWWDGGLHPPAMQRELSQV